MHCDQERTGSSDRPWFHQLRKVAEDMLILQQLPVSESNTELFVLLSAVLRSCVSELSCVTNVFAVELKSFPPFNGRTRQVITLILHSPFPLSGGIVLHKTSLPLTAFEQRPPLTLHATIGTRVVQVLLFALCTVLVLQRWQ